LIEIVVVIIAIAYLIPDRDSSIRFSSDRGLQKKNTSEGDPEHRINDSRRRDKI
jgi:hypothetical protein